MIKTRVQNLEIVVYYDKVCLKWGGRNIINLNKKVFKNNVVIINLSAYNLLYLINKFKCPSFVYCIIHGGNTIFIYHIVRLI